MPADFSVLGPALITICSLGMMLLLLVGQRRDRLDSRLKRVAGKDKGPEPDAMMALAKTTLPKIAAPLIPKDDEERTQLQTRLIHAGLYRRQAFSLFLGVKMLLMAGPVVVGLILGLSGVVPFLFGLLGGAIVAIIGMIGAGLWLDRRKKFRQTSFRRALPDALDLLVICLEGGLSLPGAFRRIAAELRTAHPLLASELTIVQREIQLGRSAGDALRQFGFRADLEEVRSLASVVIQSERYGASLVKALRVHAETMRDKRMQYAEEMAQKASTKMLFPTIFLIFPGMFIVILGPAAYQIMAMLSRFQH